MVKQEMATVVADAAIRATPPVAVTAIYGVALPDIVAGLTVVYLVIQIAYIVNKWRKGV